MNRVERFKLRALAMDAATPMSLIGLKEHRAAALKEFQEVATPQAVLELLEDIEHLLREYEKQHAEVYFLKEKIIRLEKADWPFEVKGYPV